MVAHLVGPWDGIVHFLVSLSSRMVLFARTDDEWSLHVFLPTCFIQDLNAAIFALIAKEFL